MLAATMVAMLFVSAGHSCEKRFTVSMARRAIDATYAGTKGVTAGQRRRLDYYTRCQRNPRARPYVRWLRHRAWARWTARRLFPDPETFGVASWYNDAGGGTACGFVAPYGVANKSLPCGTRVRFYYGGRSVDATVDDRGPYIAGRTWDFGDSLASYFNYFNGAGVASVGYRIGG